MLILFDYILAQPKFQYFKGTVMALARCAEKHRGVKYAFDRLCNFARYCGNWILLLQLLSVASASGRRQVGVRSASGRHQAGSNTSIRHAPAPASAPAPLARLEGGEA
jgi:hypothetical protein